MSTKSAERDSISEHSLSRRDFIQAGSTLTAGTAAMAVVSYWTSELTAAKAETKKKRMGIGSSSYGIHNRLKKAEGFRDPLTFLEFCKQREAGGIQLPIGQQSEEYSSTLNSRCKKYGMYLEGSIRCPRVKSDVARFEAEVSTAKLAGATVLRTVMLSGRRYETFHTLDEFQGFKKRALKSLELAVPILEKHKMTLAIENHKDFRRDEFVTIIKSISSERVGICVDTGNNISLLDDPIETAKAFAPWTVSAHLKDMAVAEYKEGFLLSEVPFGDGIVDLKSIVDLLHKTNPEIQFSLEMITRDPLKIPCLTKKYWATFPNLAGRHLAEMLATVRQKASEKPLPRVSHLSDSEKLAVEDENARKCLTYAREHLGL